MTKLDRLALSMAAVLVVTTAAASVDSFARQCAAVRGQTLRLHVVAHSDAQQDQDNKLLVRDAIVARYSPILSAGDDAQTAFRLTGFLLGDIEATAGKTLRAAGDSHPVSAEVCRMYFGTSTYDDGLTLPAGEYAALRVVIGDGGGKNWWCVMYPPLCIPAAGSRAAQQTEARIRALRESPGFEAKFAVVELAQRIKKALS